MRLELKAIRNSGDERGTQKWSWPHSLNLSSLAWCVLSVNVKNVRLLRAIHSDVSGLRELAFDSYYPACTKGHCVFQAIRESQSFL